MTISTIHLSIVLPTSRFLKENVSKVKGEGMAGEFCLKPNHIDYVTALIPGIFSYATSSGRVYFLAMDQGILIKKGSEVKIASINAVSGELGSLSHEVKKMLDEKNERERQNRSAVAKLEAGFLKQFFEFSHLG